MKWFNVWTRLFAIVLQQSNALNLLVVMCTVVQYFGLTGCHVGTCLFAIVFVAVQCFGFAGCRMYSSPMLWTCLLSHVQWSNALDLLATSKMVKFLHVPCVGNFGETDAFNALDLLACFCVACFLAGGFFLPACCQAYRFVSFLQGLHHNCGPTIFCVLCIC